MILIVSYLKCKPVLIYKCLPLKPVIMVMFVFSCFGNCRGVDAILVVFCLSPVLWPGRELVYISVVNLFLFEQSP